jgi:AcrR family transcriptional regulator
VGIEFRGALDGYDRSCYCQGMNASLLKKNGADAGEPCRSKGQISRAAILHAAAKLATTKGLDGLSIGDLAAEVGMSKSGLYAHFKRVFPGGCFFAAVAAELDTRPGPARERVVEVLNLWLSLLKQCILDAQAIGEIDPHAEVDQVVFEIQAMLLTANFLFVMTNDSLRLTQSRRGVEDVLGQVAVRAKSKKRQSARDRAAG